MYWSGRGATGWAFINGKWTMESGKLENRSIIERKSFDFAVRIVNLYQYLCNTKKEFILSRQLLKAGTSIGANVAEAQQAQSKADFISKISFALKEATETKYWIKLLRATDYLTQEETESVLKDCVENEKILTSILKSSKK